MPRRGHVFQLSISGGGVPKLRTDSVEVGTNGIEGDSQDDTRNHGGPERAVCLFAVERVNLLKEEGHNIVAGALGENITTEGIDWEKVRPGSRFRIGDGVLLEVTRYTTPCWKNAGWFSDGDFQRINQASHSGWSRVYARVLQPGRVTEGDPVELTGVDSSLSNTDATAEA